jgi:hypothetical protein
MTLVGTADEQAKPNPDADLSDEELRARVRLMLDSRPPAA